MRTKVDAAYWREILLNPAKALDALRHLEMQDEDGRIRKLEYFILDDDTKIPLEQVTQEQAHAFMKRLCPSWALTELPEAKA